ncbi:MAG TPA: type III PLP-dependent enzyme [Mycobacteriales bacterium]
MRTPYLLLDLDRVEEAYRELAGVLPGVDVHYAVKCNPDPRILARLHGLGGGFEVASATEVHTLAALGVDPAGLLYSNPVKPAAHVRAAAAAGVWRFALDSTAEAAKLAAAAPGSAVYVRLRTDLGGNTVPSEGKFGVDGATAAALLRQARELGLRPYGIAFHVGSQMLVPEAWDAAVRQSGLVMADLARDGIALDMLDLGGGFPARYADDEPPPLKAYAEMIATALDRHLPYRPGKLAVEPGRALVADAGTMVATVIGIAERSGRRWAHLDVGAFNGFMEALESGNRLRFPVADSRASARRASFHLTGPTCDSQDTIMFDVRLSADLAVDDRVLLGAAGAYTTSYASTFNGFPVPPTVIAGDLTAS